MLDKAELKVEDKALRLGPAYAYCRECLTTQLVPSGPIDPTCRACGGPLRVEVKPPWGD